MENQLWKQNAQLVEQKCSELERQSNRAFSHNKKPHRVWGFFYGIYSQQGSLNPQLEQYASRLPGMSPISSPQFGHICVRRLFFLDRKIICRIITRIWD